MGVRADSGFLPHLHPGRSKLRPYAETAGNAEEIITMDNEIAFIREQIDRQVRPGQVGAASVGQRAPGFPSVMGGSFRPAVVHASDGDHGRGLWDRAKYGTGRYA